MSLVPSWCCGCPDSPGTGWVDLVIYVGGRGGGWRYGDVGGGGMVICVGRGEGDIWGNVW